MCFPGVGSACFLPRKQALPVREAYASGVGSTCLPGWKHVLLAPGSTCFLDGKHVLPTQCSRRGSTCFPDPMTIPSLVGKHVLPHLGSTCFRMWKHVLPIPGSTCFPTAELPFSHAGKHLLTGENLVSLARGGIGTTRPLTGSAMSAPYAPPPAAPRPRIALPRAPRSQ